MFSVKGIYENGKIQLLDPLQLKENSEVIITFLDEEFLNSQSDDAGSLNQSKNIEQENKDDTYYEKLREHKRFKAKGDIHLMDGGQESQHPLYDYSAGGLSFISDTVFEEDKEITATLQYKASGELLVMDFEIEVKRIISLDDKYKIGCKFLDGVDEDLWHMIMGS